MSKILQTAREYNESQQSPHMRFRTESGKERVTGFVVTIDGNSQWFPNFGQARKAYKNGAFDVTDGNITPYDFNS